MDDQISQKGTKTKAREATHGPLLASAMRCPECGGRHVIKTVSKNALGEFMCARCGAFFSEE